MDTCGLWALRGNTASLLSPAAQLAAGGEGHLIWMQDAIIGITWNNSGACSLFDRFRTMRDIDVMTRGGTKIRTTVMDYSVRVLSLYLLCRFYCQDYPDLCYPLGDRHRNVGGDNGHFNALSTIHL